MNKDGNNKLIVKQKDLKEKKQSIGKHETRHEIGQKQIRTRRARGGKKGSSSGPNLPHKHRLSFLTGLNTAYKPRD